MSWDDLSMREKAAMMRVAVKNKIFEIDKIKEAYNNQDRQVSNSEVINPNQDTPSVNLNINPALDYVGNALESISGYEYEGNPLNKLGIDMSFDLGTTGSSMYPNGIRFVKKFDKGGRKSSHTASVAKQAIKGLAFTPISYDIMKSPFEQAPSPFNYDITQQEEEKTYKNKKQKTSHREGHFEEVPFRKLTETVFKISEEQHKKSIKALESLDKQQLKDIQQKLLDDGYYYENIKNYSRQDTKKLQRLLVKKGYLNSKKEIDGIVGDRTQNAYEQYIKDTSVDGILGNKTRDAYGKSIESTSSEQGSAVYNWGKDPGTKMQDGCAKWVTKKFDSVIGGSKQHGVILNAWQMPKAIEEAGGEILLNLYDDPRFKNVKNVSQLKTVSEKVLSENKFDYNSLQEGDVVGIYLRQSGNIGVAFRDGTTYNSHVGIVVGRDDNGVPIVEHKMPTGLRRESINKLKNKITVVSRPALGVSNLPTLQFTPAESQYEVDSEKMNFSDNMQKYMNSIAGSKDIMKKLFPDADVEEAEKIAIAVQKRETNYMNPSQDIYDRSIRPVIKQAARTAMGMSDFTKSSELAKIKLSSFSPAERKILGLLSLEDLENPEKAGVAAMYLMCKNYDYLQRLSDKNKGLGMTKQDIIDGTILSYNQGMGTLKSIGFDKNHTWDGSLENLRDLSTAADAVPDISSSDYRHFAKLGSLAGRIGDMLYYSGEAEPKNSYIYHAKKTFNKYIKRKDGKDEHKYNDVSEENEKLSSQRRLGKHNEMYDYSFGDWLNYILTQPSQEYLESLQDSASSIYQSAEGALSTLWDNIKNIDYKEAYRDVRDWLGFENGGKINRFNDGGPTSKNSEENVTIDYPPIVRKLASQVYIIDGNEIKFSPEEIMAMTNRKYDYASAINRKLSYMLYKYDQEHKGKYKHKHAIPTNFSTSITPLVKQENDEYYNSLSTEDQQKLLKEQKEINGIFEPLSLPKTISDGIHDAGKKVRQSAKVTSKQVKQIKEDAKKYEPMLKDSLESQLKLPEKIQEITEAAASENQEVRDDNFYMRNLFLDSTQTAFGIHGLLGNIANRWPQLAYRRVYNPHLPFSYTQVPTRLGQIAYFRPWNAARSMQAAIALDGIQAFLDPTEGGKTYNALEATSGLAGQIGFSDVLRGIPRIGPALDASFDILGVAQNFKDATNLVTNFDSWAIDKLNNWLEDDQNNSNTK